MLAERHSDFRKVLSHSDALTLLELIRRTLTCDDFRSLVPFDYAICGTAHIRKDGGIDAADIVNISYPAEWLALYVARRYYRVDPVIMENFESFAVQYWDDSFTKWGPPKDFLQGACDFGLGRGYSHGLRGPGISHGSIFSFSGKAICRESRTEVILMNLVPHLHNALNRISRVPEIVSMPSISIRERDILNWVRSGKTNSEIGAILGISENTVKYHLKAIMQKLDASTRAQAVAVAMAKGAIELE
jgi:DNA-binding CsgD family transcriptional regulator